MINDGRKFNPFTTFLLGVITFVLLIVVVTGSALAGYFSSQNAINKAKQTAVVGSIAECRALRTLATSGNGIKFPAVNAAHPSEEALTRIFRGIDGVYAGSHCAAILNGTYKTP